MSAVNSSEIPALEVRGLTVRFGHGKSAVVAVNDVSFAIFKGRVLGLVGESGSGKSTLARAIAGLVKSSSGDVTIAGRPASDQRSRTGRPGPLQMVFQDPSSSLNPRLSVGRAIEDAIPRHSFARLDRREEVARLLNIVSLHSSIADRYPRDLSGGQRQRVAIARGLAANPAVLVCDEITSALDVSVQGAILNLIADLRRELGLTILFISHNLAVVRHVSDEIAVMRNGSLVELGAAEALLSDPREEYTRALRDAIPDPSTPIRPQLSGEEFGFLADSTTRTIQTQSQHHPI